MEIAVGLCCCGLSIILFSILFFGILFGIVIVAIAIETLKAMAYGIYDLYNSIKSSFIKSIGTLFFAFSTLILGFMYSPLLLGIEVFLIVVSVICITYVDFQIEETKRIPKQIEEKLRLDGHRDVSYNELPDSIRRRM